MPMLSYLLRCALVDARGQRADLADLAVDLLAGDYPPVQELFIRRERKPCALPWTAVRSIDWPARRITVADLAAAGPVTRAAQAQAVLLKRDVPDALMLDLEGRR